MLLLGVFLDLVEDSVGGDERGQVAWKQLE